MTSPRVVIGVPLYNGGDHLAEALESLLNQRFGDFRLVLTDDCSADATPEIAERYATRDGRLSFERSERRLGMIGNWRRAFELARQLHPDAEYFAWASDHDVWHPRWLESVVRELDEHPSYVMAYTKACMMGEAGAIGATLQSFENVGVTDPHRRLALAVNGMTAGNMIYGLFRRDLLERCGPFPSVLLPDRLLLARLALHGELRQVPDLLWYRRYREGVQASFARQRASFYPDGVPLYARLPWWVEHAGAMARWMTDSKLRPPGMSLGHGEAVAVWYLKLSLDFWIRRHVRHQRKKIRRFFKLTWRRNRRRARRILKQVLRFVRRLRRTVRRRLATVVRSASRRHKVLS